MSKPVSRTLVKVFTAVTLLLLASFATTNASSTPRGSQAARSSSSAYAPEVVTIAATKTDSLFTDVNSNTLVDPGDTLQYSIVVGNGGDEDALNTLLTDITDDTEVTFVAGSLRATPIGRNDAYDVIGNTHITHAVGTGLLTNDIDPDGGSLTASCSPCTSANGGTVTLNANGSFTYNPPVGFTGTDTFTYTVTDNHGLTDTGAVTFNVTNRIWWVDSAAAGGGDGRALTPFNTIGAAQTASAANDIVFVYDRGVSYTGGFVMDNGERLCGHGSSLQTCSGITPPAGTTFPTVSTNPTITNAAGAGITLAQNNTIFGITVGSTTGFGITGVTFGTLTAQNVTINTGNGGLSLTTGTANVTFNSITSTGGTNNITLTTVAGTLNLGSGALSGSSSHAFTVNGGTAAVSYSGTISNSAADAVLIQNKTSGSVTLSGAVTSTGTGVSLLTNTGATINLSGGLALNTGTNEAFTATGGGTVNVTGINTVATTTGTAVNIRNMTIGASGVTFRSVSANGGANGIYLDSNTGGTFTVSGTGSAGSGGTIQNMTGANGTTSGIGIYLTNTGNVSLNWMQLNGFSNFAIRGITASNVTLTNSVVSGTSGDSAADDEGAISFTNLTGTLTFTNNTVSGGHEDNVRIVNSTGTLNATVSGSTIRDNTAVSPGNNGLWFQADGTANITALITTSSFLRNRANGIQAVTNGAGVMDITVGTLGTANSGGTFQDNNIGVNIAHNSSGTLNFDVQQASFQPVALTIGASPININLGALGNQMSGTVRNNFIRNANSPTGPGIRIIGNGAGTLTTLVNNNNIAQIGNRGIEIIARDGSNRINATVTNNTVALTDPLSADGIRADAGAVSTDTTSICANINNNTSTTIPGLFGIRVRQRFVGTTYQLQGYGGSATDMTAVQNFLSANNNGATTLADFGGGGFTSAVCPTPSFTEPVVVPFGETVETDVLTNDVPALPVFTGESDLKDETNPKQAAQSLEKVATPAILSSAFAPETPEATTTVGPFTLPPGESTTITFRVVVNDPFPAAQNPVCNQATISGSNFSDVLSDDPDVAGAANPTCTTINITADLSITKSDGAATAVPGQPITYTITASNAGPNPDPAATVADTFPAAITGVTWACIGAGGATCTASGSGDINETVNLPVGGSVTFTASGTISPAATGNLANTATVATSSGITDPVPGNNSATDTNTLTPQADMSITKTDGQTSDIPGTSIVYTIVASNAGPSNDPAVTIADTFPAALTGVTWTCAGAGGGVCTGSGTGDINDTASLPVGGSVTYTVNATIDSSATGTLSNTATATASVTDPNAGNNAATDNTTLTPQADVGITKTDGQTSDIPGTSIIYTIVASNVGPSDAPSVTIADTFPAILSGVTWTCAGAGGGVCTGSGTGDINDAANLPAGGSVTYTINATIAASATGTLSNIATASSSVTDPNAGNNAATDNTTLTPQADLAITKTDGMATAVPGQSITYTIVATNAGPSDDPSATVADTFPAILSGVTWTCVGAGGATCTAAGSGNINDTANLPVGGSVTYTASGTISGSATGTLVNTATVASSVADPNAGNNSATDTDTLTPQADLAITKTDGVATAVPGQSVTYTIVASNAGPSNAPGAMVADTFPAILSGVTWTCAGAGGATCTAAGSGNINDTVNLPAGGSVTYTASGIIDVGATGTLANTATVAVPGGVTDPNTGNNSATDTDTLTPTADLAITKTDGLVVAVPGQATTYTITVSNAGPSNAPSATVADTFPATLTGVTWTCSGTGGGTCTAAGSGNINDTVNLPAGGSVIYIADATIDTGASGILTNTATVAAPGGVTDPNTSNNSATDSTSLDAPPEITALTVTPGTIDENGSVNLSVTFTDPNTPETHEVVINWGDGSADTIINLPVGTLTALASHPYLDDNPTGTPSDNYTVVVTVNEPDGGTDSDTAVVTVNNVAPNLFGISVTSVNENGFATLSGSMADPGTQDTYTLLVDWGDGSSDTYNYAAGTTSFSETHQYLDDNPSGTSVDNYNISLTLSDDDTGSAVDSTTTTISNVAPALSNVAVTANVDEGGSATLSGLITDPGTQDTFTLLVDWGDGSSDTYNYPAGATSFSETHLYADDDPTGTPADNVTISLTLTDDDTGSNSENAFLTVHNVAPDLSNLAATPLIISETNTITLTGSIADPGTPDTFALTVDWADGNVQTVNYPAGTTAFMLTHIYQDDALIALRAPEADFTIDVTLTDDDTGSDTDSVIVTVDNVAPTLAGVSISSPVDEGSAATLSGSISDPSPNDTFALLVDWGDGNTDTFNYGAGATSFSETHIYVDDNPTGTPADVYTVTLTLTDDNGGSDSDSTAVTVQNVAPALSNVLANDLDENGFTVLTFTINDPGTADDFTLAVDWGDGSGDTFNYPAGTTIFTETHQYLDDDPSGTPADNYTISLTLTDDDTGSDTDGTVIIVSNVAPTVDNLAAAAVSENGFTTLSGDITDPGTLDTFTVVVDWGDGITETFSYGAGTIGFSETHQYLDDDPTGTPSDDYTISVTVTDDDMGMGGDTAVLTVSNVAPDLFNIAATPVNIDENNSITVTGQISDVGTLDSFTLTVDWADGLSETFSYPVGTTSFLVTHLYEDDGLRALLADFDITLTLTDDDTGSDSEMITVQVDNVAPMLDNVTISDPINEADTATLSGSIIEVSPADSFTLTVAWGDGAVDSFAYGAGTTSFSQSHTYADDNPTATPSDIYTVTLTLVDDNGGTAVHMTSLTVNNVAPAVDAGTDMAVNTGTAVTFNGSFSDIGLEDSHTIAWDFGDGNIATGTLTPNHTYSAAGVYTTTLTVTDDDTGVASDQVIVTVSGSTIFLPIIMNSSGVVSGPDLVVSSLTAVGSSIEVVVTNQGNTAVSDDFWVDVYIDPDPVPTMVNQTWQLVAAHGLVWGVSSVTLNPGQSLTLTINDVHYRPELSDFTGPLPTGTPVYAQVDSANTNTTYGNVLENHENSGGVYNNITGTTAQ